MKKIILSIAIIAGIFTMTNLNSANAAEQPAINLILEDDGFVDVRLEDLNEQVQASINGLLQDYDVQELKYNSEEQLTKVALIKKDDQSSKVVYFDATGKEKQKDANWKENQKDRKDRSETDQTESMEQRLPSAEITDFMEDDGFVTVKIEDLNENVQNAIREIEATYDVKSIKYNNESKITKVTASSKEDWSEKVFLFNDEGKAADSKQESSSQVEEESQTPIW